MIDRDGKLHLFDNQRLGQYRARTMPANLRGQFEAVIAAAPENSGANSGAMDFILLRNDGAIMRLSNAAGNRPGNPRALPRADRGGFRQQWQH